MNSNIITSQLSAMLEPEFLKHFLYLAVAGMLLLRKGVSDKQFNLTVYLFSAVYFLLFYGQYIHIFTMAGDNICQIAYWKILFHPSLTGSIGAAYTKPGQLLILGTLFELSTIFGENAFRIGLCIVMAACVWSLVRIATDIGDRGTGLVAFLASSWVFLPEFIAGSYSIFLIPTLFTGLWLYYFKPEQKSLGMFLLLFSIQFHIQAITVLVVVWLTLLIKKEWKELATFSAASACSIALWLLVILRVQGTFERINSGAAVGYVAPFGEAFAFDSKLDYILKAVTVELSSNYSIGVLLLLAAIGVAGSCCTRYKAYLSVFSVVILLVINVVMLNGTINLGRYFSLVYAFSCSVGISALLQLSGKTCGQQKKLLTWLTLIIFALLQYSSGPHRHQQPLPDYVTAASTLMYDRNLPFSTRLMTEDDLLYPIVALFPDRYPSLTSLQFFNVSNESKRRQLLSTTDYIWVVTNNRHPYYYLRHTPLPEWQTDKFRAMVNEMMQDHQPKALYGFVFTPIGIDAERLLITVKPSRID